MLCMLGQDDGARWRRLWGKWANSWGKMTYSDIPDFPIRHLAPGWWGKMANFYHSFCYNFIIVATPKNLSQVPFAEP